MIFFLSNVSKKINEGYKNLQNVLIHSKHELLKFIINTSSMRLLKIGLKANLFLNVLAS